MKFRQVKRFIGIHLYLDFVKDDFAILIDVSYAFETEQNAAITVTEYARKHG